MSATSALNVKSHGAAGDGTTDDAPAIQALLDTERPHLYLPFGTYKIGQTLRIGSHTQLVVHPQTRLVMADNAGTDDQSFLLTNRHHEQGDQAIEVRGGIWDGNNSGNPRIESLIQPGAYTGRMINFRNVKGLIFADALLANAESYYFAMTQIDDFLIEHIRFHTTRPRHNNDGIHFGGFCEYGIVRHLRGLGPKTPSDDMIAMNADDAMERVEVSGMLAGPIRNVTVYDIEADHCHTFVRLLSTASPIENILIEDVRGGCDIAAINADGARQCRVQVFDANDPAFQNGIGTLRNIRIQRLRVYKTSCNDSALLRLEERVDRFVVENLVRDEYRDVSPDSPTVRCRYLSDHQLEMENLNNIQLEAVMDASTCRVDSHDAVETSPAMGHSAIAATTLESTVDLPFGSLSRLTLNKK